MIRKIYIFSILALIFIKLFSEKRTLVIGYDDWSPYTDQKEEKLGICFEIVDEVLKDIGYDFSAEYIPFKRTLHYLKTGKIIDASPYLWYSKERAEYIEFSEPIVTSYIHFFSLRNNNYQYENLKDLKMLKIGTVSGYYYGEEFTRAKLNIEENQNVTQGLTKLLHNRFELAIMEKFVALKVINKLNLTNKIVMLPKPVNITSLYFGISKKHPRHKEIIKSFNIALRKFKNSNKLDKILLRNGIVLPD